MVDPNFISTLALASIGMASSVGIWALRLEGKQKAHEATDLVVHKHVSDALTELKASNVRMEEKIDRLIERHL